MINSTNESKMEDSEWVTRYGHYEGPMLNGLPEGIGTLYMKSGDIYHGMLRQGQKHGKGIYFWKSGVVYEGDFIDGRCEGNGFMMSPKGGLFLGQFKAGMRHGYAICLYPDEFIYCGSYRNDREHGYGSLIDNTGKTIYDGEWICGKRKDELTLIETNDSKMACIVCYQYQRDTVFLPCKHIVCCSVCSLQLNMCPICRKDIISRHEGLIFS